MSCKSPENSPNSQLLADPPPFEGLTASSDTEKRTYNVVNDEKLRGLRRQFHPAKQLRRLLLAGFFRWLVTALLVAALYGTLWHFSSKTVMSSTKKRYFNALVTGLSICLGLNIASSLKAMAIELRWWVLSRKKRSLREVDLLLHSDSLSHLVKFAFTSRRLNAIVAVLFWFLLNIASQIGVATLGLTYSVDAAENIALTFPGNVSIPDMSELVNDKVVSSSSRNVSARQYTANSYGAMALTYDTAPIEQLPSPRSLWTPAKPLIFSTPDSWVYAFTESSPNVPGITPISIITNRTITSTSTCRSWPVVEGGNGATLNITIMLGSADNTSSKTIPVTGGDGQTTYFIDLTTTNCGPGCSQISAFEASTVAPWYYECNVTTGNLTNSNRKEHEVGESLARMASGAIALQGFATSSLSNNTNLQTQIYPAESIYGAPQNGTAAAMGRLTAQFAISVIGITALYNPSIIIPGDQPRAGVTLNVTLWTNVHIILGLTAGVQFVLFVISAFLANRVVVKHDSHLTTAKLLRPIVDTLGAEGSIATAEEICKVIGADEKFIYSVQSSSESREYRLDMGSEKRHRVFPRGTYR